MTRTHRTHRWRKATVLALCLVYSLVLLHPTTPDAAVTPLEWVVIGTTVASFLLNAYRSSGPDVTGTVVFQNKRMLKELHARFDTFGQGLEEIAQAVANIPEEVRYDINQALSMYRLHEVDGLRTRIADCAELVKNGEKCDYNLDQLWTDYVAQTAAFFNHGGLAAIALPELYEFERFYLHVTKNDSPVRLRQLRDNYVAAVWKLLEGLPNTVVERAIIAYKQAVEGPWIAASSKQLLEEAISYCWTRNEAMNQRLGDLREVTQGGLAPSGMPGLSRSGNGWKIDWEAVQWVLSPMTFDATAELVGNFSGYKRDAKNMVSLLQPYIEVIATMLVFARRLDIDLTNTNRMQAAIVLLEELQSLRTKIEEGVADIRALYRQAPRTCWQANYVDYVDHMRDEIEVKTPARYDWPEFEWVTPSLMLHSHARVWHYHSGTPAHRH